MKLKEPKAVMCPVCGESQARSSGQAFQTPWAVSCHIAGCANAHDRDHAGWLSRVYPSFTGLSVPKIAKEIEWFVSQVLNGGDGVADRRANGVMAVDSPYEKLCLVERLIHELIREVLIDEYGDVRELWWTEGIPLDIRKSGAQRREEDEARLHPYNYIDLIDLRSIFDKRWAIIEPRLRGRGVSLVKGDWTDDLLHLNAIRRKIMHPLRGDELTDEEVRLLDQYCRLIGTLKASEQSPPTVG